MSVQSRLEKRMAIHIAASEAEWKKPGSYDEFTQRALEEAGLSQRKPTANALIRQRRRPLYAQIRD